MKRIIQTYKAPEDWAKGPPGMGDFIRGACHLFEMLDETEVEFRIDISQTEFFDLIEYDESIFHIGDAKEIANAEVYIGVPIFDEKKIANGEVFDFDYSALYKRIEVFLKSSETDLYICTNLGVWNRKELPKKTREFIQRFYQFNGVVEKLSADQVKGRSYEMLSIRCGQFDDEDQNSLDVNLRSCIYAIIEDQVLPNAKFPILVTSDSYSLKCELADKYCFIVFPHHSKHGAYGGALPVAIDLFLLKNSKFNYHINTWAPWWSGFSHYTSIIFNISSVNFRAPHFIREEVMEQNNSPVEPVRVANHTARRVNTLAKLLNAETYLEIGVLQGDSFLSVNIKNKTGVDPHFTFDKSEVNDPNISLAEDTSDRFFSMLAHSTQYDIIFIGGSHTFEQAYRDFCNSLLHSNSRTVFIIDDVRPNDVYSTLPNWEKACQMRQENNNFDGSWHGDVFKVIFALHDFHPALNYRTIIDSGNPQTLVWRSNLGWREPLFNSLEKISRLSYFDLVDHIDVLKGCSEEEAVRLCVTELCDDTEAGEGAVIADVSEPVAYSLRDAIGLAFEKFNTGDASGTKAICDQLLGNQVDNFYVYYLSGIVASHYQNWDLAKNYLQQSLEVAEGIPAERIAEVSLRLQEVDKVALG